MVKCLVRIRTKVPVTLRMANHCTGDLRIRVLNLGPLVRGPALPPNPALAAPASSQGHA